MKPDWTVLVALLAVLGGLRLSSYYAGLSRADALFVATASLLLALLGLVLLWEWKSVSAKRRRALRKQVLDVPEVLRTSSEPGVHMGEEVNLRIPVYLPDAVRTRHVHIIGATGSGKTESVILNFLRQDVERGLGAVILDAKGDFSFLSFLKRVVPEQRLKVFDLGSANSLTYDPLEAGEPMEAAQRLFSSLTWSEEYYQKKAFAALKRMFQTFKKRENRNPRLAELAEILETPVSFSNAVSSHRYPLKQAEKDYAELGGLKDQIDTLCMGYLATTLSPAGTSDLKLEGATKGEVLYFRLQSLMSPQLVSVLGRLLINHLNFFAGTAHRNGGAATGVKLIPTYLDEFASFVCPEFADLISKARSAGFALHFSHQSLGQLKTLDEGFLDSVTDNCATKIVLRVSSPETAEYFSRSFGTKIIQKITQRITNVQEIENAEVVGEGTQREAHQFRASPDLLKTLPTGTGSVLVAHGMETSQGASTVFRVRFPKLT